MSGRLLRTGKFILEAYDHQAKTRPFFTMSWTTGLSMVNNNTLKTIFILFKKIKKKGYWKLHVPNDSKKNDKK